MYAMHLELLYDFYSLCMNMLETHHCRKVFDYILVYMNTASKYGFPIRLCDCIQLVTKRNNIKVWHQSHPYSIVKRILKYKNETVLSLKYKNLQTALRFHLLKFPKKLACSVCDQRKVGPTFSSPTFSLDARKVQFLKSKNSTQQNF